MISIKNTFIFDFITGVVVLIPIGFTLYLSKILIRISSNLIPKNIDIGFSHIVQNEYQYQDYVKDKLTMKDMLKSKFLISIEGNDVATSTKWIMSSNSF